MKDNDSKNKNMYVPLYPLRSSSKMNQVPMSMLPNAKSLVKSGYFVTTTTRIDRKRQKLGLPPIIQSNNHIAKLIKDSKIYKKVGADLWEK